MDQLNVIWEFLQSVVDGGKAQVLVYLILANLAAGIAVSVKTWTFEVVRLKDFIQRAVTIFAAYVAVSIAANAVADFDELVTVAWVALVAYLVAKIVKNLKEVGLPVPEGIAKLFDRSTNWEFEAEDEPDED